MRDICSLGGKVSLGLLGTCHHTSVSLGTMMINHINVQLNVVIECCSHDTPDVMLKVVPLLMPCHFSQNMNILSVPYKLIVKMCADNVGETLSKEMAENFMLKDHLEWKLLSKEQWMKHDEIYVSVRVMYEESMVKDT